MRLTNAEAEAMVTRAEIAILEAAADRIDQLRAVSLAAKGPHSEVIAEAMGVAASAVRSMKPELTTPVACTRRSD